MAGLYARHPRACSARGGGFIDSHIPTGRVISVLFSVARWLFLGYDVGAGVAVI